MADRLSKEEFANLQLVSRNEFYLQSLIKILNDKLTRKWTEPWLQAYSNRVPQSITGHQYTGSNALFLWLAEQINGYATPVYITLDKAIKMGLKIKKDAKPEFITRVDRRYYTRDKEKTKVLGLSDILYPSKYDELKEEQKELFRCYSNVRGWIEYNICNTNMEEMMPDLYKRIVDRFSQKPERDDSVQISIKAMDKLIADGSWVCPIKEEEVNQARFHDEVGNYYINVPSKEKMINDESYYSTLVHEMIHSTQIMTDAKGDPIREVHYEILPGRAREELVAEIGSAMVLCELGISPAFSEDNAAYLDDWFNGLGAVPVMVEVPSEDFEMLTLELNAVSPGHDMKPVLTELAQPGVSVSEALRNNGFSPLEISAEQQALLDKQEHERIQPMTQVKRYERMSRESLTSEEGKAQQDYIAAVVSDASRAADIVISQGLKINLEEVREKGMECVVETKVDMSKKREPWKKRESTPKRRKSSRA